jgi:hypothetical protein
MAQTTDDLAALNVGAAVGTGVALAAVPATPVTGQIVTPERGSARRLDLDALKLIHRARPDVTPI